MKDGCFDGDFTFELYDYDEETNEVIKVAYTGCYVIVDNGYLKWSVTVPPMKHTNFRNEICFSEWIESMRKDVECTFGILKGRWRILRYGIKLWGIQNTDKVWLTCCALHNWLLEIDGLAEGWENGVQSNWETEVDNPCDVPFALKRLKEPGTKRYVDMQLLDLSGMGIGNDVEPSVFQNYEIGDEVNKDEVNENEQVNLIKKNGRIAVCHLSMDYFWKKLIRHFNIAFQREEVEWPRRIKKTKNEK